MLPRPVGPSKLYTSTSLLPQILSTHYSLFSTPSSPNRLWDHQQPPKQQQNNPLRTRRPRGNGPILPPTTTTASLRAAVLCAEPPVLPIILLLRLGPYDPLASFLWRRPRLRWRAQSLRPGIRQCLPRVRVSVCRRERPHGRAGWFEDGLVGGVWDRGV